ncbi:MAG: hypothetical protein QM644_00410 [Mobilitalea sp.]
MLSRDDIMQAILKGSIKIFPFNKRDLTGIGYNLSTTNFAFSVNNGILLTVRQRTTANGLERYVIIPGNDTVLFFSKEYISIDNTIAGTFHSKVSRVCQGLGHISTTLDPTWKGQLIISVNNPTCDPIIFELDRKSGNLVTMLLYKLDSPVTGSDIHDNNRGRCDVLLEHFSKQITKRKFKEKHLELKKFVVSEFANSLNGYDDFLDNGQMKDKYSVKVFKLLELKKRLETDRVLLTEDKYIMGENGEYHLLSSSDQQVILSCTIAEIEEITEYNQVFHNVKNTTKEIVEAIDHILKIIEYELEMINHIRRIQWQNNKVDDFASEEAEIVKERRREIRKRYRIIIGASIMALILMFTSVIYIVLRIKGNVANDVFIAIITIAGTFLSSFLILILQWWYKSYKDLKISIKET